MISPNKIIIHHSAGEDRPDLSWAGIRDWHIDHLKFIDIGYHAGVEWLGDPGNYEILIGRDWTVPGAHTLGWNADSLGLCLVGNFNLASPPESQYQAAARICRLWMKIFQIDLYEIHRHDEYNSTQCPGMMFSLLHLRELIRGIKS